MKNSTITADKFYQNLGRLFYAIAFADGKVHDKEFDQLKKLIQTEWINADDSEDEFGSDAAYQIEIVFDWLRNEEAGAESNLRAFTAYMESHPAFYSKAVKDRIWKTACAVASAYAGRNKSELVMLDRLRVAMKP